MNGEMELVVRYKSETNTHVSVMYKQSVIFSQENQKGSFLKTQNIGCFI